MLDKTLIIPDTGPEFLKALRLASLYSEKVQVFTLTNKTVARETQSSLKSMYAVMQVLERTDQIPDLTDSRKFYNAINLVGNTEFINSEAYGFTQFTIEHANDLECLADAGIIYSITDTTIEKIQKDDASRNELLRSMGDLMGNVDPITDFPCEVEDFPPSVSSLLEVMILLVHFVLAGNDKEGYLREMPDGIDFNKIRTSGYGFYLLLASYYASLNDATTMTWNPKVALALKKCHKSIRHKKPGHTKDLIARTTIQRTLGEAILQEEVPNVTDLPFCEIIEIRRKRQAELEAFRTALREIAASIDPTLEPREVKLAIDTKVATVVKPAIRDLNVAVSENYLEALKRLRPNAGELGIALSTVTFALSQNAVDPSVMPLGTAGVLGSKLYELIVGQRLDRKKLLNASPWSLLYHMKKDGKNMGRTRTG